MRSLSASKTFRIKQAIDFGTLGSQVGTTNFGTYIFSADMLPSTSALTTLFDRYRILSAEVQFLPVGMQINTNLTASGNPALLHTAVDFDDNTAPSNVSQLQSYNTYAGVIATNGLKRCFVPRALLQAYVSGVSTGYVEKDPNTYIDCANSNMPHYALKYALTNTANVNQCTYSVKCLLEVEFSGLRA